MDTEAAAISNERGAEHPQEPEPMWHQTQSPAAEQGGFICNDPRNGETHRGVGRGATSKNHGGTPTPRPGRGCRRPGALSASPPEAGVPSGGRCHLRVSAGEQDEGVAARGRPDAPQGPMLPLPEVPVMRDHRGDEQRCSAVVPARCLANRPNGHSGAGDAGSVDAGRALCLAGAAVSSGASGGGRRSEGESFTEPGRGRGGGRGGPADMPPTAANSASRRGTHGAEQGRPLVCEPRLVPGLPRIYLASAFPHQMHENTQEQLVPCPGWALGAHTGLPPAEAFPRRLSPGPPRRGGRGRNHQQTPDVGSAASRRAGTRPAHG